MDKITDMFFTFSYNISLILFLYYTFSLTLLKTILSLDNLKIRFSNDYLATIYYFSSFFILILVIPFILTYLIIKIKNYQIIFLRFVFQNLFSFKHGNYKIGLILSLISIPLILLAQKNIDKEIILFYPFSKQSLKDNKKFLIIEFLYFSLYYISWEALFRGFYQKFFFFIFYKIQGSTNLITNISLNLHSINFSFSNPIFLILFISVNLQTLVSTLFHIGHPKIEIFASLIGGFIFGIISIITQSIFYTVFIHAFLGITIDYNIKKKIQIERQY